jgi:hypothetical protein
VKFDLDDNDDNESLDDVSISHNVPGLCPATPSLLATPSPGAASGEGVTGVESPSQGRSAPTRALQLDIQKVSWPTCPFASGI